ncbi:MAG: alkaline phosphatase family protein [Bacteroidales bacterium]|nr:alkaline phosphatase family protein [Bacteroidales bacterium]
MFKKFISCTFAVLLCVVALAQGTKRDRYVVIVSFDGFRHDYIDNNRTPNFDKMAKNGVSAVMMPSYPASTFPNHYAMATGLVPDHNGLVNNSFWEPEHKVRYSMGSPIKSNSYFYLGEPIWNTAQRQGVIAGVTYWVSSEFVIGGGQPRYYLPYADNELLSFENRVKRTAELLSLPEDERPRLVMLYFSEPDHTGHNYGPHHRNTAKEVRRMDKILGQLRNTLAKLPIADNIDLIVVSDHGMTDISPEKCVSADKYLRKEWMERCIYGTPTSIFSKNEASRDSILAALRGVEHLHVWKKEEVPAELNYGTSERLGDIIVAPELGWRFSDRPGNKMGGHGYFPSDSDMQTVFRAEGPDFKKGFVNPKFRNVSIYVLACHLLGIEPAPNDGDLQEVLPMLLEK